MKADGYGLGAARSRPLCRARVADTFSSLPSTKALNYENLCPATTVIVVFDGLMAADTAAEFDAHSLTPVLNSPGEIKSWSHHATNGGNRSAFLALDTGMNRLGLSPAEVEAIAEKPEFLDGIEIAYVMSHLACADEATHPQNSRQRQLFDALRAKLPAAKASFANSAGIFLGPEYHYDLARPGAALYGVSRGCGAPQSPCNKLLV